MPCCLHFSHPLNAGPTLTLVLDLRLTVLPPRNASHVSVTLVCTLCTVACTHVVNTACPTYRTATTATIKLKHVRMRTYSKGYGVCVLTVVVPCTVCPAQELRHGNGVRTERKSTGWIPSTHEKDIRGSLFLRNDRHSQIKLVPCFHEYGRRFESSV